MSKSEEFQYLPQSTIDWLYSRVGKANSSNFSKMITEPKLKKDKDSGNLSQTANSHIAEILSELANGEPYEFDCQAIRHGNLYEPVARQEYEFQYDVKVEEIGSTLLSKNNPDLPNAHLISTSVDGLVGDNGLIEIKCPINNKRHLRCFLNKEVPKEHLPQIQGQLWITGREWCDFVSFNPFMLLDQSHLRMFVKRVKRDDDYIGMLSGKVMRFVEVLIEKREELKLPEGLEIK